MKSKILVLGSSGMIGHQVYNLLQSKNEFILFDLCSTNKLSEETILVDVRDFDLLTSTIKEIQPNIIINYCKLNLCAIFKVFQEVINIILQLNFTKIFINFISYNHIA